MDREKALLVYSGWLGDFVWIIPTIKALRSRFKSVSLVVSDIQGPLALGLEGTLVDKVYVGTRRNRAAVARSVRNEAIESGIGTFIDIKGRGKAGLFIPWHRDIQIYMPDRHDAREYTLARLLHPFATCLPPRDPASHMVDGYLGIARFFGAQKITVDFRLSFPEHVVAKARSVEETHGLRTGRTVVLSPGSAQFSKIWPAKNYRALADTLQGDLGCKVVVMGARNFPPNGNYDMIVAQPYMGDRKFVNLIGRTDILTDSCLLQSGVFDVAVGNDSFAGHMAGSASEVAAETPMAARAPDGRWFKANRTVSLFGPTNPVFCRPYDPTGKFNTILQPAEYPADCKYDRTSHTCPHYGDRKCFMASHCMPAITVEQVVKAVEWQLNAGRAAHAQAGPAVEA